MASHPLQLLPRKQAMGGRRACSLHAAMLALLPGHQGVSWLWRRSTVGVCRAGSCCRLPGVLWAEQAQQAQQARLVNTIMNIWPARLLMVSAERSNASSLDLRCSLVQCSLKLCS